MADPISGLTDAQMLGDPSQQPQAPAATAPTRQVVWSDTGLPVTDPSIAGAALANNPGGATPTGISGTPSNPLYVRDSTQAPPGSTYVDDAGTHVAPGVFQPPSATPAPPSPPPPPPAGPAPTSGLSDDQMLGDPASRATVASPGAADSGPLDDPWPAALAAAKANAGVPDMPSQGGWLGRARAIGSGVLNAVGGAGDMVQTFGEMQTGDNDLSRLITSLITGQPIAPRPTPRISDITNAAGGSYQPFDDEQRYEKTGGEFLGNAALGEGGLVRKGAQVIIPTLTSQGASDGARALGFGPTGQTVAGVAGGLVGGGVASLGDRPIPMLPKADQGAADAVNAAMKIGGTDPGDLTASLDAGRPPMASDPGLSALGELVAHTPGPGRAAVRSAAQAHMAGEAQRVLGAVQTHLGVDPTAAMGGVDSIVANGRAAAKPLFDAALGDPTPVWNSQLEALSKRPVIQRAIQAVIGDKLNAGEDPHALGLTFMENPGGNAWEAPGMPGETSTAPLSGLVAKAPRLAPTGSQGPSLLKFMADNGGINDAGGEVSNMDGNLWHEGKPFQSKLVNDNGLPADRWAEKAQDAGFLPPGPTPGPRDLFDAMGQELRGRPIYANGAAAKGLSAGAIADEQAYHAANYAPDDMGPDAYGGSSMPQSEPVPMAQPTAATWDAVRQAVGRQVERNPVTGRPLPDAQSAGNYGVRTAGQDLTSALAGDATGAGAAIPGLRPALNVSGDYLKVENAYDRASGTLFNGPASDFSDLWSSLKTGPEQDAARAALANDVVNRAGRGLLKGGSFKTPDVQQKLLTAFGDKAQPFIDQMEREASERAELGGMVGNSPTAYRLALNQHFTPPKKFGVSDVLQWGGAGLAAAAGHAEPLIVKSILAMEHAVRPPGVKPWEDAATSAKLGEVLASAPKMKAFLSTAADAKAAQTAAAQARVRQLQLAPMLAAPALLSGAAASPDQPQ